MSENAVFACPVATYNRYRWHVTALPALKCILASVASLLFTDVDLKLLDPTSF